MRKVKAKGTLAKMLSSVDEQQLYETENDMLNAIRIAEALRECGWTNQQFADEMGCPVSDVIDWLSGTGIAMDKLSEIEKMLNIKLIKNYVMVPVIGKCNVLTKKAGRNSITISYSSSYSNR